MRAISKKQRSIRSKQKIQKIPKASSDSLLLKTFWLSLRSTGSESLSPVFI